MLLVQVDNNRAALKCRMDELGEAGYYNHTVRVSAPTATPSQRTKPALTCCTRLQMCCSRGDASIEPSALQVRVNPPLLYSVQVPPGTRCATA